MTPRQQKYLLALVLLSGMALRFVGITRGYSDFVLPEHPGPSDFYHFNPDEETVVRTALASFDPLRPELTAYGSLPIYLLQASFAVTAALTGTPMSLDDPESERLVYCIARILAALASCATLALTWLLGMRLYGPNAACLGAFFTAFSAGAIQQAHFYIVDGLFALCSLLAIYLMTQALLRDGRWRYVACGMAIGATAAVRLNGVLLGLVLAASLLLSPRLERGRRSLRDCVTATAWAGAVAVGTLIALQPFLVVDPQLLLRFGGHTDFAMSLRFASGDILQPWTLVDVHSTPFWDHWFELWPLVSGWPLTILFAAGLAACAQHRRAPTTAALIWAALYFITIGGMQAKAVRHVIPLLPLLSLFAAATCVRLHSARQLWLRRVVVVGVLATATYTIAHGSAFVRVYLYEDSRLQAGRWIASELPPGAAIGIEGGGYTMGRLISREQYRQVPLKITRLFYVGPYMSCDLQADYLRAKLMAMDYIAMIDVNGYAQFTAVPDLFPAAAGFYRLLVREQLGFERVAEFEVPATILGVRSSGSDPSFSGYDHPAVWLYRKSSDDAVRRGFASWSALLQQDNSCPDAALGSASEAIDASHFGLAARMLQSASDRLPTHLLPELLLAEPIAKLATENGRARR